MTELFSPNGQAAPQDQPQASSFEALVGAGKKFQDQEALAKGKIASDTHITQLEAELKTLRDELQKRLTVEELAAKIEERTRMEQLGNNQPQEPNSHPQGETISKNEIFEIVKNTINQERTIDQARRNVDYVRQDLTASWGPDFHLKLQQVAKDLDISQEFLGSLAESNPQGFLKVVKQAIPPRVDPNGVIPPRTTTTSFGNVAAPGSWQSYQDMKKNDPKRYWSRDVQAEIHRQAIAAYNSGKDYIPE